MILITILAINNSTSNNNKVKVIILLLQNMKPKDKNNQYKTQITNSYIILLTAI